MSRRPISIAPTAPRPGPPAGARSLGRLFSLALAAAALAAAVVQALAGAGVPAQLERKIAPRPVAIIGGTLIDGSGEPATHNAAILVADGRIKDVGLDALRHVPKDARRIDATGKWIVPGLVDAAVHLFETGGLDARPDLVAFPGAPAYRDVVDGIRRNPAPYLRSYICSGVTAVVDQGGPGWVFDLRDSRRDDALSPRLAVAGPIFSTTVPAALQVDGEPFRAMKSEGEARADVERLAPRHPDLVAVRWVPAAQGDVDAEGRLVKAVIDAAHRAGLRVAVHAATADLARRSVDAGADALVHGAGPRPLDDGLVAAIVRRKVIYVPALAAGRNERTLAARGVAFEPIERECAPPATIESFEALAKLPEEAVATVEAAADALAAEQANLKRVADAGGLVAAGSGAGSIRTLHGASLHVELALMAEAGMTPMQVLVSATRHAALLMGRERELGQVRAGMAADLVVLDADPLADIRNTRKIFTVIRGGAIYQR